MRRAWRSMERGDEGGGKEGRTLACDHTLLQQTHRHVRSERADDEQRRRASLALPASPSQHSIMYKGELTFASSNCSERTGTTGVAGVAGVDMAFARSGEGRATRAEESAERLSLDDPPNRNVLNYSESTDRPTYDSTTTN